VLVDSARTELDGRLEVTSIEAGLQTIGWLAAGVDGARVAALAAKRGVEVKAIAASTSGRKGRHALLLGFAAVDGAEIRRGVRVLGEIVPEAAGKKTSRRKSSG